MIKCCDVASVRISGMTEKGCVVQRNGGGKGGTVSATYSLSNVKATYFIPLWQAYPSLLESQLQRLEP